MATVPQRAATMDMELSEVCRSRIGLPYVRVLDGDAAVATRFGLTPRMARRLGGWRIYRLHRRAERQAQAARMDLFDAEFTGWIMRRPDMLNLSPVYTSRIGLPYVFVLFGDTTVTARLGLTPGMARWLGALRIRRLHAQAEKSRLAKVPRQGDHG